MKKKLGLKRITLRELDEASLVEMAGANTSPTQDQTCGVSCIWGSCDSTCNGSCDASCQASCDGTCVSCYLTCAECVSIGPSCCPCHNQGF